MPPWGTLALLCLFACLNESNADTSQPGTSRPLPPNDAMAKCAQYADLYENIYDDLARWKSSGISLGLMESTVKGHTITLNRGFTASFRDGKAYLLGQPAILSIGHHAQLFFVYMRLLLHLERLFVMPDVDFVISTIDRPLGLNINASSSDLPVFRFCKTNSHADVLIPIFHFHMKDYDGDILSKVPEINAKYPWESKKDIVFGRFSLYLRHFHHLDPAIPPRLGANGANICNTSGAGVTACQVRTHFVNWSKDQKDLDVSNGGRIKMIDHAKFKYLIHMDGQGLSSRLDQLLPLNSLVLKEESGYRTFYHHLLKPHEHFVPFWKQQADDILDVLKWARENDAEAKRIAANGQQLALKYLNHHARSCYWYHLLTEFARLLRYKPGQGEQPATMQVYMSVEEYLATVAREHEGGKKYFYVQRWTP